MEKKYREIEFLCGWNIERAVIELLEYKENGELVCGEFNGHMLYSDTVTMDNGKTDIRGRPAAVCGSYRRPGMWEIYLDSHV